MLLGASFWISVEGLCQCDSAYTPVAAAMEGPDRTYCGCGMERTRESIGLSNSGCRLNSSSSR